MWRRNHGALLFLCLAACAHAAVFSEGGSGAKKEQAQQPNVEEELERAEQYRQEYLEYLAQAEAEVAAEDAEREEQERQMADEMMKQAQMEAILAEMQAQGGFEMNEDEKEVEAREAEPVEEERIRVAPAVGEELQKDPVQPLQLQQEQQPVQQGEQIDESAESQPTDKAPTAQKKGQSEFVSFVDPEASKLIKSVPSVDKRRASVEQERMNGANKGGTLLFLAVGCVMAVGMVGALIGGLVRYRKNREEPDDQEYAPYAGTGPRSKKPIKGEKGDDTLAYKAQLHHYQQAKQKIICGEDNAGVAGDSEEETDEIDDENNFSVYECPGLAPTGDIEVHNPNFAIDPRP